VSNLSSGSGEVRDLALFTTAGYDKGRPVWIQAAWFATMNLIFMKWWCPATLRPKILRAFGANIAHGVFIRHRVRVLWPWKLTIDQNCWIGEGAWLLNLEPITIDRDVCISQDALICTGGHDPRAVDFAYRNSPISLGTGSWIGARAIVLPGVSIGSGAVVGAGAVVAHDVPQGATILCPAQERPA
jgi:putative colanic acid biosynthesis acetyltransferase WcaF